MAVQALVSKSKNKSS